MISSFCRPLSFIDSFGHLFLWSVLWIICRRIITLPLVQWHLGASRLTEYDLLQQNSENKIQKNSQGKIEFWCLDNSHLERMYWNMVWYGLIWKYVSFHLKISGSFIFTHNYFKEMSRDRNIVFTYDLIPVYFKLTLLTLSIYIIFRMARTYDELNYHCNTYLTYILPSSSLFGRYRGPVQT